MSYLYYAVADNRYRVEMAAQAFRSAPFVFVDRNRWRMSMKVSSRTGKRIGRPLGSKSKSTGTAPHERPKQIVYPACPPPTPNHLPALSELLPLVKPTPPS